MVRGVPGDPGSRQGLYRLGRTERTQRGATDPCKRRRREKALAATSHLSQRLGWFFRHPMSMRAKTPPRSLGVVSGVARAAQRVNRPREGCYDFFSTTGRPAFSQPSRPPRMFLTLV